METMILIIAPFPALLMLYNCVSAYRQHKPMALRICITVILFLLWIAVLALMFSGSHWCEGCQEYH